LTPFSRGAVREQMAHCFSPTQYRIDRVQIQIRGEERWGGGGGRWWGMRSGEVKHGVDMTRYGIVEGEGGRGGGKGRDEVKKRHWEMR
jgi:hypothetical protein